MENNKVNCHWRLYIGIKHTIIYLCVLAASL